MVFTYINSYAIINSNMTKQKDVPKVFRYLKLDSWQRWEYKHTTTLLITLAIFILLLDTALMAAIFQGVTELSYLGVLIAGVLFVSLFTAAPAVVMLIGLSESLGVLPVAIVGGIGAMLGDYLILRFAEDKVAYELKPLALKAGIPQAIGWLQGRRSTTLLVKAIGAIIIASPLPDEIGVGLLGVSKASKAEFLVICFLLNSSGIALLLLIAKSL